MFKIPQFLVVTDSLRCKIYQTLLICIVHKKVPHRPERYEPRVTKRRPKAYAYMSKPKKDLKKEMAVA
ncbi:MAG: hypothetical protein AAF349_08505 [Cyanobacteria bacterium P01_A01_bin.68]